MSNENTHPKENTEITSRFDEIKSLKPSRQGVFLGEEKEKFYVAKTQEEIYELSALAYYVWLLCDGEHTVDEIADRMSNEVKIDRAEVIEPLVLALTSLSEVGLVRF